MNFVASPVREFGQKLVHVRILLAAAGDDLLDDRVALRLGLQDLAGVGISLRLELVGGDLVVALSQRLHLLSLVENLRLLNLLVRRRVRLPSHLHPDSTYQNM